MSAVAGATDRRMARPLPCRATTRTASVPSLSGDGCPPEGLDPPIANERAQRVVVPFAMRYVAGKGRFTRYLDPISRPPGIEVIELSTRHR
jgi:hypothetical protein